MTTTFEANRNLTRANYSTLPTIDVEILPEIHHCTTCGEVVEWDPKGGPFKWGTWVHPDLAAEDHDASPRTSCRYCHNDEPGTVHFHQRAWSDETECDRCGGITGYAIGD